jgi:predicted SprT family Zn-dependent metalloprotease
MIGKNVCSFVYPIGLFSRLKKRKKMKRSRPRQRFPYAQWLQLRKKHPCRFDSNCFSVRDARRLIKQMLPPDSKIKLLTNLRHTSHSALFGKVWISPNKTYMWVNPFIARFGSLDDIRHVVSHELAHVDTFHAIKSLGHDRAFYRYWKKQSVRLGVSFEHKIQAVTPMYACTGCDWKAFTLGCDQALKLAEGKIRCECGGKPFLIKDCCPAHDFYTKHILRKKPNLRSGKMYKSS